MATVYVRRFNLKDSLTDAEVLSFWKFLTEEALPVIKKIKGVQSVKFYSGAGALRADLRIVVELDDAGVYERLLMDPATRKLLPRLYGPIDLSTSTQAFMREISPALISALSGA